MIERNEFIKSIEKELKESTEMYEVTLRRVSEAPEGYLTINRGDGIPQYYLYNENNKVFLPKSEHARICSLAQKHYDTRVLTILKKRIAVLERIKESYRKKISNIYMTLSKTRQSLVTPILPDRDQALQEWLAAHPGNCNPFPMATGFQTERGDMVRSKSEKIIADLLYRLEIPYVYEAKLELNNKEVVYPDFLLYHPERREMLAYEHFGMMGSEEYAGRAIRKIYQYEMSGFTVGINFMYSMECAEQPLNVRAMHLQIERWWNAE